MKSFFSKTKTVDLNEEEFEQMPIEEEATEIEETEDQEEETPSNKTIQIDEDTSEGSTEPFDPADEDWFGKEGELAIDVYQTDKDIVIQSAIAGVRPENIDISIEDDVVTIRGVRKNPNQNEERQYFHEECFWGPFSRQIFLPEEINAKNSQASMKDGIFTLRLPKIERETTKKIKIAKK